MTTGFMRDDELVQASSGEPLYVVQRVIPRIQRVQVLDVEKRDFVVVDDGDLRFKVASGELRVLRRGKDWAHALQDRSHTDDTSHQNALQFLSELLQLRRQYQVSFHRAHDMLVNEVLPTRGEQELKPLSLSQSYRLWTRERNGVPLHVGNAAKGNRARRYPDEVYDTIENIAKELFLKPHSRWTLRQVTQAINGRLHETQVLPKSKEVSRDFVKRTILSEADADPSHVRMDPKDAIAAKAVACKRYRVASVFERVEQDALHLPWVLRTPHGDSNKVYLVHAIDCATSLPLGWTLVIGAPRTPDTLRCVESILFPKRRLFDKLGLNYDFDVYGTPNLLVLDNGSENKSERVLRLSRLSITVNRLKARHAQEKPFIERLNRSLKEFLETLPGCTRFDGEDGGRDPVALGDPVMTIEEMERWIVRFYFEQWANTPLRRLAESVFIDNEHLGSTPLKRYRVLTEEKGCPVPLPPSLDAWRSTVYDQEFRKLSRKTGISYSNFHFQGDRLRYLIDQFGESDVQILIDRDDFRWIYVVDKDGRTLVPLVNSSTSEVTPAYSYDEAAVLLAEADDEGVDITRENVRRDVLNRSTEGAAKGRRAQSGAAAAKLAGKSKETTTKARRDNAVQRSAETPRPPLPPSLGHPPLGSSEDDWTNVPALDVFDRRTGEIRK